MADIKLHPFSEAETSRMRAVYDTFDNFGHTYIRTEPGNFVLPQSYEKFKDILKNFPLREDDVFVCTFPKNGTTWTQELVWLLLNDCDFEKAKSTELNRRAPFIEFPMIDAITKGLNSEDNSFERAEQLASPRVLKSHLRYCLLPDDLFEKTKVVACLRNPKDTVVSYFHHEKIMEGHGFVGDFQSHFDLFMDNLVMWSSYFDYITEAWQRRNHPNLCLLFYEDMKKDLEANVKKVAKFLGKELTDGKVDALVDHLSFKKMKNNKAVNHDALKGIFLKKEGEFMRKGEVGDWKNYFTDEMNKRMDEAIDKHFKPIGLEFKYEL